MILVDPMLFVYRSMSVLPPIHSDIRLYKRIWTIATGFTKVISQTSC